ncbi:XRCC1 protein, partial [Grantiella picta]|nr:XRCC1 protein [Grantiella picta]
MPEIHFTRVVSVSSADPRFPAENLLKPNDGGRWRGAAAGEKQLSVVLEVKRKFKIFFGVLLPTSALMSPAESRAGLETRRVRIFGPKNLVRNSSQGSWDRLRVVLSQPYCQSRPFGLSFIRVFSAPEEEKVTPEAPV